MKSILSKISIVNNDQNTVVNKEPLNTYGIFLNNIKNIKNTYLDISIGNCDKRKEITVDVAKLSKELISKIRELYTSKKISSYRVDIKNKEKSMEFLNNAYKVIDSAILEWWEDEKEVLPSSIIHRTIDNLYIDEEISLKPNDKKTLFFLISNKFKLGLNKNAAQSTMIQNLQDIPEVVKAIDDLGISDNSHLKYEVYCLLAENIYNFLSGNENKVDFSKIKDAIKDVAQRKFGTSENKLTHPPLYSKYTLAFFD
ncbi:hypothetical protein [Proteus vulgaris]|uniref:IpaB/EvcA family n=1 Tax=Proteus vulgaris TaxID=585 RepID=A0A6G6SHV5_PROVU|nr:hypothetical protein [Proteus vulgaris]QIF94132.1 hypothetical protein GTH24_09590 [Proteus vulgaris]